MDKMGWRASILDDDVVGGAEIVEGVSFSGNRSMRIWIKSNPARQEWGALQVDFFTEGKRHQRSLLMDVSLSLAIRPERGFGENGRLRINIKLSQQPPSFTEERLVYVLGEGDDKAINLRSLETGKWNIIRINLTEDALKYARGGADNVFGDFTLLLESRRGEYVELFIDDFQIHQVYECQSALNRQKELARVLSYQYGLPVYVGIEFSMAGPHMTALGSWIPILDYNEREYSITDVVSHVKSHGGVISINHPFSKWKRQKLSEADRENVVRHVFNNFKNNRCYGVDLIEVGFPEGRHGFPLKDYLKLWDLLSCEGIVITGIGVSDAHNNEVGWDSGNNFVNWIRSEANEEKSLISGLQAGDVYMSDPTLFRGSLEFVTTEGHRMGQIIIGEEFPEILLRINGCKPGWKLRWIINGIEEKTLEISDEKLEFYGEIRSRREFNFTRFEVYDENGRCVLLTNPIYFAKKRRKYFPQHKIVNPVKT